MGGGDPQGCIGRGGRYPPPGRPAYAQPLFLCRQVLASIAFVTGSNDPQPLWQPPPSACLTASGAASKVPPLLMHPWGPPPPPTFLEVTAHPQTVIHLCCTRQHLPLNRTSNHR